MKYLLLIICSILFLSWVAPRTPKQTKQTKEAYNAEQLYLALSKKNSSKYNAIRNEIDSTQAMDFYIRLRYMVDWADCVAACTLFNDPNVVEKYGDSYLNLHQKATIVAPLVWLPALLQQKKEVEERLQIN